MISTAGRFSPCCNSKSLSTTAAFSFSPYKTQLAFAFSPRNSSPPSLLAAIQQAYLGFRGVHDRRSKGSVVYSRKKQRKGGVKLVEMDDSDDDDEEELDLDFDGSDDELGGQYDDDEETIVPFGKMKRWLERKPRGFGEGKEYDISLEEKLLEEIEKSKQAQVENLSDDPEKPNSKQNQTKNNSKAVDVVVPAGVGVRVLNLPKKKNIHRDLSSAFKLVPGLISINPAVTGNKKTKDPICKGFAFVHFKSEIDATRFVEMFSSQSVTFGKIQKQIKCELVGLQTPSLNQERSTDKRIVPRLPVRLEGNQKADSDSNDSSLDAWEESQETEPDEYDGPDAVLFGSELGDAMEILEKADSEVDDSSLDAWDDTIPDEYYGSDVEIVGPELENAIENMLKANCDLDDETWDDTIPDEYDGSDIEIVGAELEDSIENLESTSGSDLNGIDTGSMEVRTESESVVAHSVSSKKPLVKTKEEKLPHLAHEKPVVKGKTERSPKKKKLTVKQKTVKVPKLTIGGSSKRLKVKEKAVLSDVFSKYGAKAALASSED